MTIQFLLDKSAIDKISNDELALLSTINSLESGVMLTPKDCSRRELKELLGHTSNHFKDKALFNSFDKFLTHVFMSPINYYFSSIEPENTEDIINNQNHDKRLKFMIKGDVENAKNEKIEISDITNLLTSESMKNYYDQKKQLMRKANSQEIILFFNKEIFPIIDSDSCQTVSIFDSYAVQLLVKNNGDGLKRFIALLEKVRTKKHIKIYSREVPSAKQNLENKIKSKHSIEVILLKDYGEARDFLRDHLHDRWINIHGETSYMHQIVIGKGLSIFDEGYDGTYSFSHTFKKRSKDEEEHRYKDKKYLKEEFEINSQ